MNERINELRLDAGISQLKDDPRLAVIDREGNIIDPLIGLEKFAELIVRECALTLESITVPVLDYNPDFDNGYNKALLTGSAVIKKHFGVSE